MNTSRAMPTKDQIATMPIFPRLDLDRICLVDKASSAREALAALRDHAYWGFDTESKPTFLQGEASDGPHVLQLATVERAWVFQLHEAACVDLLGSVMMDSEHTKVGFGLGDDTKRIQHKFGITSSAVVELNQIFQAQGYRKDMGVKGAVAVMFGQRFSKSKKASTSNWANRTLTSQQIMYAANDDWAAAVVYSALKSGAAPVWC